MDDDDAGASSTALAAFRSSVSAYALQTDARKSTISLGKVNPPSKSPFKRCRAVSPPALARTPSSSSPSPNKKQKRGYAPPETYAHLDDLHDHLQAGLDVVFCGINPGEMSAETGHHFAHPTNRFWKCLHRAHLTDRLVPPTEDATLPARFRLGLTNLVPRPTAEAAELSKAEMSAGVLPLLHKLSLYRPRIIALVGGTIWDTVRPRLLALAAGDARGKRRTRRAPGTNLKEPTFGLQRLRLVHPSAPAESAASGPTETLLFALPSPSGRCRYTIVELEELYGAVKTTLGQLERGEVDVSDFLAVALPESSTEQQSVKEGATQPLLGEVGGEPDDKLPVLSASTDD